MAGLIPYKELVASEEALNSSYERHHLMAHGAALKERLSQTPRTDQLRLLDSSALESTLAGNPWFEANYPGSMELKFHAEAPPKQEDVNALYSELHGMVHEALERAEASGKQLLILAGEHHTDRNSLLLEHMLLDIAHKAGLSTVIDEHDAQKEFQTQDNLLYWQEQGLTQPPKHDATVCNGYFWDISPFDHLVLGDPVHTESKEWNLNWNQQNIYREMHMIKALATEVEGHAVGIYGSWHLQGLIEGLREHPSGGRFEILPMNLTQCFDILNRRAEKSENLDYTRFRYNQENIAQLIVPGKEVDAATAWDMAAEAAAHFERKGLGIPDGGFVSKTAQPQPDMITARGR